MFKFQWSFLLYLSILLNNFQPGHSLLQCYLCSDCGDPFSQTYPYVSVVTNQNYGAACMKTVSTVSYGKVVSRGTTFNCVPTSTSDIKVYCCQTDLCNGSNSLKQLSSLLFLSFFIRFMFY